MSDPDGMSSNVSYEVDGITCCVTCESIEVGSYAAFVIGCLMSLTGEYGPMGSVSDVRRLNGLTACDSYGEASRIRITDL